VKVDQPADRPAAGALPGGCAMPIEDFLEECRQVMRLEHLSYRTEET
jgi:hypothetical protein